MCVCVRVCVFQVGHKKVRILSEVVEITVENEIIIDLPEPIRIDFYHDAIPVSLCALVRVSGMNIHIFYCLDGGVFDAKHCELENVGFTSG